MISKVLTGLYETFGGGETCLDLHIFVIGTCILADIITVVWMEKRTARNNYVWFGVLAGFMFCNNYGEDTIEVKEGYDVKGLHLALGWFVFRILAGLDGGDIINWGVGFLTSVGIVKYYR
ncbi:hypothetical protein TrLO_g8297 [Triparma laevis f. longispina]|uniref:Uncharacterized protein n=1 Tax=Triparma laevis f. longispina TaxID=1714387 RepID=A0A9W7AAU3_9STRA|nr:hypothetical protein TrLO_g8297 [Triparma laevis f. longispina]